MPGVEMPDQLRARADAIGRGPTPLAAGRRHWRRHWQSVAFLGAAQWRLSGWIRGVSWRRAIVLDDILKASGVGGGFSGVFRAETNIRQPKWHSVAFLCFQLITLFSCGSHMPYRGRIGVKRQAIGIQASSCGRVQASLCTGGSPPGHSHSSQAAGAGPWRAYPAGFLGRKPLRLGRHVSGNGFRERADVRAGIRPS